MTENTHNSIMHICLERELQKYNLEGKWNDYIAVQKEVLRVLKEADFFADNIIIHKDSGMAIKITPRGIRETFGTGKRFNTISKSTKQRKIATIFFTSIILMKYKKVLNLTLSNGQSTRFRTFLFKVFELLNLPNG